MLSVALNQIPLTSLGPEIVVLDVLELPPVTDDFALPRAHAPGEIVMKSQRTALPVRILLELHEPDRARRKALCSRLAQWCAGGGELTLSDRPGQTLFVDCDQLPTLASAQNWTDPVEIRLTARDFPFWRTRAVIANSAANTYHALTLHPSGNAADVPVEVQIRPQSQCISVILTTPGHTFTITGLSLAPGELLTVTEEAGRVAIRTATGSFLHCRTPDSSDRLLVPSGRASVLEVYADAPVEVSAAARGAVY